MDRKRLDGWKAIASHLNRSVRQCQRFQSESGLPIHRIPGKQSVFAYVDELDRWLAGISADQASVESLELSRSGRHVMLPVDLLAPPSDERSENATLTEPATPHPRRSRVRRFLPALMIILLAAALLALGIHHHGDTGWRNIGTPLTGSWTFQGSGVVGKGASVARFDADTFVAPGTAATVVLSSSGTRWSGGLEIFQDDLHWTFVALSPREHEIVVQRFPAGTVETFFLGQSIEPSRPTVLRLTVGNTFVQVGCAGKNLHRLAMDPWDIRRGKLMLRVGSPGDELHEPSGGTCFFKDLEIDGAPRNIPSTTVSEVPFNQRPTASYVLAADNIDDQLDVLIDGRRLACATYREKIGPLNIDPYLTRGRHTITARLFNRKWTAAYGIRLTRNGSNLWNESCGDIRKRHSGCNAIGNQLGMVKQLSYTFDAE
ncbi:MAG TPA: hypothetical protein ENK19_05775 [Acidobacteria bacterium]|nr:hypothetical protein [Acidobacteriota bacterium]